MRNPPPARGGGSQQANHPHVFAGSSVARAPNTCPIACTYRLEPLADRSGRVRAVECDLCAGLWYRGQLVDEFAQVEVQP